MENKPLFEAVDPLKAHYDDQTHLVYITALLGPAPKDLLARGTRTSLFYDPDGEPAVQQMFHFSVIVAYLRLQALSKLPTPS